MATVEWNPYKSGLPEVTDADLDQLESERGVKLPPAYRTTVKAHRGETPSPGGATVGKSEASVNALFFVKKDYSGADSSYNAWKYIEDFDAELPADLSSKFVPFISDSGHVVYVFDYRKGDVPGVTVVDTEYDASEDPDDAIIPVADSFEAFLDGLHD